MAEDLIDHALEPLALLVVVPDLTIVFVTEAGYRLGAADGVTWHVMQQTYGFEPNIVVRWSPLEARRIAISALRSGTA